MYFCDIWHWAKNMRSGLKILKRSVSLCTGTERHATLECVRLCPSPCPSSPPAARAILLRATRRQQTFTTGHCDFDVLAVAHWKHRRTKHCWQHKGRFWKHGHPLRARVNRLWSMRNINVSIIPWFYVCQCNFPHTQQTLLSHCDDEIMTQLTIFCDLTSETPDLDMSVTDIRKCWRSERLKLNI